MGGRSPFYAVLVAGVVAVGVFGATDSVAGSAAERGPEADICLAVDAEMLEADAWPDIETATRASIASRLALFPAPMLSSAVLSGGAESPSAVMQLEIIATGTADASDATKPASSVGTSCLEPDREWTVRVRRGFLDEGADRMLAQGPTTPGIDSNVDVEWFPEEGRVLTRLRFAGPLDIPNGTCWIDDTLTVDAEAGRAVSSIEHGVRTSIFAESACGRFFDHLVNGGAGEQAITLLPSVVPRPDGSNVRFVASSVKVEDGAIVISGSVEVR